LAACRPRAGLPRGRPDVTPFFSADLVDVTLRPEAFLALPGRRFAARFFGLMARSTLPAAFLAPAAATFSLLLAVRFALLMALFASTSVAFARRCTLAVAARALFATKVRAFPAPRVASDAATFARFQATAHFCACHGASTA
jgi:hypothetical protein